MNEWKQGQKIKKDTTGDQERNQYVAYLFANVDKLHRKNGFELRKKKN